MSDSIPQEKFGQMWTSVEVMVRDEGIARTDEARRLNLLRNHLAHWEIAELFQHCLPLAIFDALRAADFPAFEQLWLPIIGDEAVGWLPSLYLAAVSSPNFERESRLKLALTALPYLSQDD